MITKLDAAVALGYDATLRQNELYFDVDNPPTEAEIQAKLTELQDQYDSKQYQRDRAAAYPSWQEQLDNIFHNGIDAWKADIQAIKNQFPKP